MNSVLFTALLFASGADLEIGLREQGVALAVSAAVSDAQQLPLCHDVPTGPCVKVPPTRWDRAAVISTAYSVGCHVLDLGTTVYGVARNILVERNPLLKGIADSGLKLGLAKAAIAGAQIVITEIVRHRGGQRAAKAVTFVNAGIGTATCGIALNNHRETQGG